MDNNPNHLVSMVNTRGRVMWVRRWEVDSCKENGARVILHPKEEYYPQYDQELNKSGVLQSITDGESVEGGIGSDLLECEMV